jgi:hypothetical protein
VAEREKWFLGSKSSSYPGFLSLTRFTLLASRSRKEPNFARGIGSRTKLQDAARGKRTDIYDCGLLGRTQKICQGPRSWTHVPAAMPNPRRWRFEVHASQRIVGFKVTTLQPLHPHDRPVYYPAEFAGEMTLSRSGQLLFCFLW